jgi:hypothetical protein
MALARKPARSRITVQNFTSSGHVTQVDAVKYQAMRMALMTILPRKKPGLTAAEMREQVLPHLPDDAFPKGKTAGWWMKCVQLDLEAKRVIERDSKAKPLRWHRLK